MTDLTSIGGTACMVVLLAAWPAWPQSTLSLRQAVERAMETHPALASGAERIQMSAALRRQAQLRFNPTLTVQTENWKPYAARDFRAGRDTDNFLYLTQNLETAGKRRLRTDLAGQALRRSELERELTAHRIASAVKSAYWRAAIAARVRDLLRENLENFQQIVDFHRVRVQEGAMPEADLLRVRLESERLGIQANSAALDADRARIALFREMGQTDFPEPAFTEDPAALLPAPSADASLAIENRPEVKLARAAIELAKANERLQVANAKPDVQASFGVKRTEGANTLMGIVQIPLPVFNRNEGVIAAASAEIRMAQSELAAANAIVQAEVRAAAAEVEMRRRQVTETFRGLLDQAEESSRIARAAYREGGWELLRLLDAERVRIELRVLYFQTLAEYHMSIVALETAMGVTP